jgi:hypothetical protein
LALHSFQSPFVLQQIKVCTKSRGRNGPKRGNCDLGQRLFSGIANWWRREGTTRKLITRQKHIYSNGPNLGCPIKNNIFPIFENILLLHAICITHSSSFSSAATAAAISGASRSFSLKLPQKKV